MNPNISSPNFNVILVEPKYGGNIGAVARVMMNFDQKNLYLVNPPTLNDECYTRAMHATNIIENAQIYPSFQAATEKIDFLVATSSIENLNDKKHLRNPLTLDQFTQTIYDVQGTIGLCFGREDYGLFNTEIAACDIMVKIPTSTAYPSLNLSHAVTIMLYSLFNHHYQPIHPQRKMGNIEKQKLQEYFIKLLVTIDYPEHKKENTEILFKRLIGRAMPSTWEYHTLMGVFSRTIDQLNQEKKTKSFEY
ncbi:MAG: RNA methyltransferase [Candidatus Thermoplasmatota archaeon]|nr:RNA methyltransferase [Candidatus Thermoplasmatota archaeon]MBU1941298.1 RNA methyltransferase [Candidatus Thermoplasmatota archaeon]